MLSIHYISALKDNYIWIIVNDSLQQAIVVDPGESKSVIDFLHQHHLSPIAILLTHKHWDHTNGVAELLLAYSGLPVYSSQQDSIPQTTHFVRDNEKIKFEKWPGDFSVIEIPGHTLGHVAYYAKPYLFTGDTLFGAGCGRLFEGTPAQMLSSLKKLMTFPDDTLIYCGHEYTVSNLKFAFHLEPENKDILERIQHSKQLLEQHKPTLPSTLALEKLTNPFLRCSTRGIIRAAEIHFNETFHDEITVFAKIREWKNDF